MRSVKSALTLDHPALVLAETTGLLTAPTDGCREFQPKVPRHAPFGFHQPMNVLPQVSQVARAS